MADRNGSRKHKWSSPSEMSPSKYLRSLDSKLPRRTHHSRERDSDSPSPPTERHVMLSPRESMPKRTLDIRVGGNFIERSRGHRRTMSLDYRRSNQQETSTHTPGTSVSLTEGDRRLEMTEETRAQSEDLPKSRAPRLGAPSLLFKRACSDILSPRGRRSLDSQSMSLSGAERTSWYHQLESKDLEPSFRTDTPKKKTAEETLSRRSESSDHPSRVRSTITRAAPKKDWKVFKEKLKAQKEESKLSPRTDRPEKEKWSQTSGSTDHQSRFRRTITGEVPEEVEVHKRKPMPCKESETSPRIDHPKRGGAEENLSWRSGSADHPSQCKRTITRVAPEEQLEVCEKEPEDTSRLVFLYDSDKGDEPEKDPSIGSDFSDVEDMSTWARFSQEEAPLPGRPMEETTAGTSTPSRFVRPPNLYSPSWNRRSDSWPISPLYKPSAEQNKWRKDSLNTSCISQVSFNAACSRNTSSDSEGEVEERWEQSRSSASRWNFDSKTKTKPRTLETSPPVDSNTPNFLQQGFIDTHCHLDMLFARLHHRLSFADLREQYSSTFPSEFQGCITDYCDPRTLRRLPWRQVLNENLVWGAFGCHPHFAQYYTNQLQEEMMQAMRHPKAIAYGEMGLDYSHKCSTTVPDQHAVFEKQLKLAVPLGKPLVIHCRNADEDLFRIMKKWVPSDYKIHRHCFTGSYKEIEPFLSEFPNMSVGFTAVLTYPSAASARDTVTRIPLDRLIIETDAPFFVPRQVPKSLCKFAHPGLALHTVEEIARLKNLPLKSVMTKVRENTYRLYNI